MLLENHLKVSMMFPKHSFKHSNTCCEQAEPLKDGETTRTETDFHLQPWMKSTEIKEDVKSLKISAEDD